MGVSSSADELALRRAYCSLSKALHPDTTSLPVEEAARRFQEVREAYEILSDPLLRKVYDLSLDKASSVEATVLDEPFTGSKPFPREFKATDVRRTLSGGELFSLLTLGVALLISLLLGIGFALVQGRELQVLPSWLIVDSGPDVAITQTHSNVNVAFRTNATQSTLFACT